MNRRDMMALLGGAAAWPVAARAQQPAMPVMGFLSPGSPETRTVPLAAIRLGLAETGYVEGQNVAIEYRWAGDQNDRLPALAADLVRQRVAAIVALGGELGALTAKAATTTIPIIFAIAGDPVEHGLVTRLNQPEGNVTGVTLLAIEVTAKGVELLHELVPATPAIALLVDPSNPNAVAAETREIEKAARALGLGLVVLKASVPSEIEAAFATIVQQRAGALVVTGDAFFIIQNDQIVALAARHGIPTVYQYRESTVAGGLMSYGASLVDAWRIVGIYAGRILKGEKPADLPVQQSSKIQLAINLKTAKALGLSVPPNLLAIADEVIE
jgi:putative ABC transport system substrate-binding protein